jgi:hypothetical protein
MRDASLSPDEFKEKMADLLLRARLHLTQDELVQLQKASLMAHRVMSDEISPSGANVLGNDPKKPN